MESVSSTRPSRSDAHLSKEEEQRLEEETREHFHGLSPKRHTKPNRSEYSSDYVDLNTNTENITPEFLQFHRLEEDNQKLEYSNGSQATEEFVETDYYKDLNCVDKLHHTTGTGFIKMDDGGKSYTIEPELDITHHASSKGNPATNDWIPSVDNEVKLVSQKPGRSDNN